jgi:hypothetical protein
VKHCYLFAKTALRHFSDEGNLHLYRSVPNVPVLLQNKETRLSRNTMPRYSIPWVKRIILPCEGSEVGKRASISLYAECVETCLHFSIFLHCSVVTTFQFLHFVQKSSIISFPLRRAWINNKSLNISITSDRKFLRAPDTDHILLSHDYSFLGTGPWRLVTSLLSLKSTL